MKTRNLALALAATTLLSTLVYASDNMGAISSSLELVRNSENYMLASTANDPFVVALTTAGWDKTGAPHYRQ